MYAWSECEYGRAVCAAGTTEVLSVYFSWAFGRVKSFICFDMIRCVTRSPMCCARWLIVSVSCEFLCFGPFWIWIFFDSRLVRIARLLLAAMCMCVCAIATMALWPLVRWLLNIEFDCEWACEWKSACRRFVRMLWASICECNRMNLKRILVGNWMHLYGLFVSTRVEWFRDSTRNRFGSTNANRWRQPSGDCIFLFPRLSSAWLFSIYGSPATTKQRRWTIRLVQFHVATSRLGQFDERLIATEVTIGSGIDANSTALYWRQWMGFRWVIVGDNQAAIGPAISWAIADLAWWWLDWNYTCGFCAIGQWLGCVSVCKSLTSHGVTTGHDCQILRHDWTAIEGIAFLLNWTQRADHMDSVLIFSFFFVVWSVNECVWSELDHSRNWIRYGW